VYAGCVSLAQECGIVDSGEVGKRTLLAGQYLPAKVPLADN
jgi:hypothetical protein